VGEEFLLRIELLLVSSFSSGHFLLRGGVSSSSMLLVVSGAVGASVMQGLGRVLLGRSGAKISPGCHSASMIGGVCILSGLF
jgi:hypothetical protein